MSVVLLALLALQAPLDEGTLLVRQDTAEIGREAFRLSAARGGAGRAPPPPPPRPRAPPPVRVPAFFAGPGRRELLVVQAGGVEPPPVTRDPAPLRHVTVRGGANQLVLLGLDGAGRLLKVEVPASRLTAERTP